jgi:alkylation response protein AidB-like acyl-CoA dehydrogenase
MHLELSEEQQLLRDTFDQLFAAESSPDRVRAAEARGFDPALWKQLVETGALGIRVPEEAGGAGGSLLEASLLAEQAGRHLATGPLVESIVACSALASLEDGAARALLARAIAGDAVVSFALAPQCGSAAPLVPGGAVATAVLGIHEDALVLVSRETAPEALPNLGAEALARWDLSATDGQTRAVLATGEAATETFERARDEWQLLKAAALCGLGNRALEIAAAYATERIQFDRPIGAFQAIAHPLANSASALQGGALLVWRALCALAEGDPTASGLIPLAFAWAAESAPVATGHALHTHGGYGLSDEYDIQLYFRRAKTWALLAGNPGDAFVAAADRRWRGEPVASPDPGEVNVRFGLGEKAEAFRAEVRRFFEAHPASEETRANQHNFDGHDPAFHRELAEAGLLFASWPEEYGGQNRDEYESLALAEELGRAGRTTYTIETTKLVAETLMEFASEAIKAEVLPRFARGEALCSLGYTEPASGSDVAAATTRATRDGDDWVINGQKMFTSGANISDYVFLLTRTNTEVRKHQGLTMFLVPLDTPGIEIQPIYTLSGERTNATYYSDVRIPDRFRVGEVDGGWAVIGYALQLEHGVGGGEEFQDMITTVVDWARATSRADGLAIDDVRVREGLGRAWAIAEVAECLSIRGFWCSVTGQPNRAEGPMAAAFKKDSLVEVGSLLMDLTAPDSVLSRGAERAIDQGALEFGYRLGTALAIYGGTSEILRSIVAQVGLGMPRSRS